MIKPQRKSKIIDKKWSMWRFTLTKADECNSSQELWLNLKAHS